ncbi:MAG: hypothetical protein LBJ70_05560 [Holosporales bacterium]|nr:hypothetical protein [Holosporales bacterium]
MRAWSFSTLGCMRGVIFVHDYNDPVWTGVKHAVHDVEKVFGLFKKIPLPDSNGTLAIVK